jgi:hypothetical protein
VPLLVLGLSEMQRYFIMILAKQFNQIYLVNNMSWDNQVNQVLSWDRSWFCGLPRRLRCAPGPDVMLMQDVFNSSLKYSVSIIIGNPDNNKNIYPVIVVGAVGARLVLSD